ncbi:hypothetical protein QAD02_023541 [Eretmocerus hayati]|uniref:Uncharacterized protein n=1 Tax=Eretmocerus hayati TaxID=131215 RepID=A0ACC2PZH6_9HYME|nr:hypothetical protein QAD02_023541 [Eretmocerus hayati]
MSAHHTARNARKAGAKLVDPGFERLKSLAIKIAVVGGIGSFLAMNSVPYFLNKAIRGTKHYQQALELLCSHPEAVKYLGEPIKGGKVNVTKPEDYGTDGEKEWYKVFVAGPKTHGHLYYEVPTQKDGSEIRAPKFIRVELTLASLPDYKLLIKRPE